MLNTDGYNPKTGEWNDSLTGDYLWSSVNTREASPDVMTPYTWSTVRNGFSQMIMLPDHLPVGNICGRIYNNASVGASVFRLLGQKNAFESSSKELYGIDPNNIKEWNIPLLPISFWDRGRILNNAFKIMVNVRKALKGINSFIRSNPDWCRVQLVNLPKMEKSGLIRWADRVLTRYMYRCFWGMVSPAMAQSNEISKLRQDLQRYVSADDIIALLSNVSTEDEFLASLGIVAGLDRLRRDKITRAEYLAAFGHRGPHEVELSIPRPAENPKWIDEQLDELEQTDVDVKTLLEEQRLRYRTALGNLEKSAQRKFDVIVQKLQNAARLTRLREAARSEGIRAMWVCRSFALCAGSQCGLDDEIFFLEYEEIMRLLAGNNESTKSISVRKTAYQKFIGLPQYPTIIMGPFDPFEWAADPNRRMDIFDSTQRIGKRFTNNIEGLPGSAGIAEGFVRVLNSPEEGSNLKKGEILVAITTNVGWTPIFPRAVAVVTDVGAPLSHAAIVARELGIPAVVGCFNATSVLKTGDYVRVDGAKGHVEILNIKKEENNDS